MYMYIMYIIYLYIYIHMCIHTYTCHWHIHLCWFTPEPVKPRMAPSTPPPFSWPPGSPAGSRGKPWGIKHPGNVATTATKTWKVISILNPKINSTTRLNLGDPESQHLQLAGVLTRWYLCLLVWDHASFGEEKATIRMIKIWSESSSLV